MKATTIQVDKEDHKMFFPDAMEKDFLLQVDEILAIETYKQGRRKKNAVYLDVGANVGLASLYFKNWAKMIYALEPNPVLYEHLVKNTKKHKNIKTFNVGISSNKCELPLHSPGDSALAQTIFRPDKTSVTAKFTGLNEFLVENKIKHVDVMKIDIESSEYVVFPSRDFAKAAKKIDFIVGESHFENGAGFPDVIPVMLKEYGFKTSFPPLKDNFCNMLRHFRYNAPDGKVKDYRVKYNTIFVAEK